MSYKSDYLEQANRYAANGYAVPHELALEFLRMADAELAEAKTPTWYWDNDCEQEGVIPADRIGEMNDVGDIVELRPLHELPLVYMLVTEDGPKMFASREAAEAAKGE
jgi:hypothetical protein